MATFEKQLLKEVWAAVRVGGAGSQEITSMDKALLASLMETQIQCLPGPAGRVEGKLRQGLMAPAYQLNEGKVKKRNSTFILARAALPSITLKSECTFLSNVHDIFSRIY